MLKFTGERVVPGAEGLISEVLWHHVYRYKFAAALLGRRTGRVVDVACGEGYGTSALRRAGRDVVGIDVSWEACAHARATYGAGFVTATAEALPLPAGSCDAVVSFETIEHLRHPDQFVSEARRILRGDGVLVCSTPNAARHTPGSNPFHVRELELEEFEALLKRSFRGVEIFGQSCQETYPRWPGYWRLRYWCNPSMRELRDGAAAIRTHDRWSRLFNPYVVRSPHRVHDLMFIAVARGPLV
jgi:2-polyprenyl-3-methyl-5-hydroxy-6-metoxy-1,4-benzoquinol methylase